MALGPLLGDLLLAKMGNWFPLEALVADESGVVEPVVGFGVDKELDVEFPGAGELRDTEEVSEVAVCGLEGQDGWVVQDVDDGEMDVCGEAEERGLGGLWRHEMTLCT